MTEQMKIFTNTLIERFLIVMWWTYIWSLWKENMMILIIMILHFMVTILSNFLHLRIPSKQTLVWSSYLVQWNDMWSNIYFPVNINSHYCGLQKNKFNNTIVSLRTVINVDVNVVCYDSNDFVPPYLISIPHNDYNYFSPLHIPVKEHDNITDENNRIERIKFERSVLIGTQDTTYDYNNEFWYAI